ncbi:MAG: hypothetical protein ACTS6A_00790 [Candidatus Hodgkinia cicadicola]
MLRPERRNSLNRKYPFGNKYFRERNALLTYFARLVITYTSIEGTNDGNSVEVQSLRSFKRN